MIKIRFTDKVKIDWKALKKKVEADEQAERNQYIEIKGK